MTIGKCFEVPCMIIPTRNRHLDDFFDFAKIFQFIVRAERNGAPLGTGTTGPANPVNVSFRFVRQIEIHHESDIFDVHPTSRHISCY